MTVHASRDLNRVPSLIGVSNADGVTPVLIQADPATGRLLVNSSGGSGGADTQYTTSTSTPSPAIGTLPVFDNAGTITAVSAANPLPTAPTAVGVTTLPTGVAQGSQIEVAVDRHGRGFGLLPTMSTASSAGTAITTNTNTQLVGAPGASTHLRPYRFWAQNSGAAATWCYLGNGSGVKTLPFYLGTGQPFSIALNGEFELSTNTALYLNTATTGANIEWFVAYESLAD